MDEYERLYGAPPARVDGHHHMHLSASVLRQELIPKGAIARRNLSFRAGEKGALNRFYRNYLDKKLVRRQRTTDYFFDLLPLEPKARLTGILQLAQHADIEVETHPARDEEYRFLMDGGLGRLGDVAISRGYVLRFAAGDAKVSDGVKGQRGQAQAGVQQAHTQALR
jgi:chitin disaccharide deacetylase